MQARLIFFTLFLTAISNGFCGRLDKIQNALIDTCPPPEEIPKCFCSTWLGTFSVSCDGPMAESEIESILKTLKEYSVRNFILSRYNASSISTDLWNGQNFKYIRLIAVEVEDTSFSSEGKRHFQGLENSLANLLITRSFTTVKLHSLQLDHLRKLTNAVFEYNNIPKVGNDWFASGPKNLNNLMITNSGIKELGDKAFASLSRLQYLIMSENYISEVSRTMLPKSAKVLCHLDFGNNQIRTLPNDIFSGMPALNTVYLNNNRIHTIEEATWKSVAAQFTWILLSDNPLECDEKMKWICNSEFITALDEYQTTCSSPPENKDWTVPKFCGKEE